jgi:hypothetical protein
LQRTTQVAERRPFVCSVSLYLHRLNAVSQLLKFNPVIVKLQGGLGNQMFQYAFGKVIAHKNNVPLFVDTSFFGQELANTDKRSLELETFPAIQTREASSKLVSSFFQNTRWDNRLRKILGFKARKVIREKNFRFDEACQQSEPPLLLDGYFQSERYFHSQRPLILETFCFPDLSHDAPNAALLQQIRGTESVSVHVRRGDYVKFAVTNSFHGTCSPAYYQRAIDLVRRKVPEARFFFFSDEPDWVKENLAGPDLNASVISINTGKDSWKDMGLMSFCKHNIIANSSFSWWGAWLNRNEDKIVVGPEKWFRSTDPFYDTRDLLPEEWIKLPNE